MRAKRSGSRRRGVVGETAEAVGMRKGPVKETRFPLTWEAKRESGEPEIARKEMGKSSLQKQKSRIPAQSGGKAVFLSPLSAFVYICKTFRIICKNQKPP